MTLNTLNNRVPRSHSREVPQKKFGTITCGFGVGFVPKFQLEKNPEMILPYMVNPDLARNGLTLSTCVFVYVCFNMCMYVLVCVCMF